MCVWCMCSTRQRRPPFLFFCGEKNKSCLFLVLLLVLALLELFLYRHTFFPLQVTNIMIAENVIHVLFILFWRGDAMKIARNFAFRGLVDWTRCSVALARLCWLERKCDGTLDVLHKRIALGCTNDKLKENYMRILKLLFCKWTLFFVG